ncbi:MAG: histidinol-phosphatase HisJ [Planctomycetes bacterium]|nr:histidinol-phosphatase HisJ [Planctomycetota bacterium]
MLDPHDAPRFGLWDGHTHSELCPHGSFEPTSAFVERAIALGFERYSLTEHPPLPEGFVDPAPQQDCALPRGSLERYLEHARALRSHYADRIEVCVGLEVDFIPGRERECRALLDAVGSTLDDALLSIHFLPLASGYACVDFSAEHTQRLLIPHYGSLQAVHAAYWRAVRSAVEMDLGPWKPKRIGHLTLAQKFRLELGEPSLEWTLEQVEPILRAMAERGMALDVNAAGLKKPGCRQLYPPEEILVLAVRCGVPLIYGSDAHAVAGVGQLREEVAAIVMRARDAGASVLP